MMHQWGPPPLAMMSPRPYKPKVLGPCFQCGGYGRIAKFCNIPKKLYPLTQPVVSSAGVCPSAVSDRQVTLETTQLWELESLGTVQIADVQGCLKQYIFLERCVACTT